MWSELLTNPILKNDADPCPCCAGKSDCNNTGLCDRDGNSLWWVECLQCGLSTHGHKTREEALETWNRRPEPENKPLTLEELREMIGQPVYVTSQSKHPDNRRSCWEIISSVSEGVIFLKGADYCYRMDDYGKSWLAHRRKPEEEL